MPGENVVIADLPRVAVIATLASRAETFQKVLPAIRAQVDGVFIYLDGYAATPPFLRGLADVSVTHCEDVGDLHASSRFLVLQKLTVPSVVVIADDDILYPADYVDRLVFALAQVAGRGIVGVHGRIFLAPYRSYVADARVMHFSHGLTAPCNVHELGTGTCAFVSDRLGLDPRKWDHTGMDDINLAIEAQRQGLPRIAIARAAGWLKAYAQAQPDSLWLRTLRDDAEPSRRMRELLALYG
ncbi:MAG TPA: hypothetical protein VII73_12870 [Caulobacteraceae bacterium]